MGARAAQLVLSALLVTCASGRLPPSPPPPPRPSVTPVPAPPVADAAPPDAAKEPEAAPVDPRFSAIDAAIAEAIAERKLPGCVLAVGRRDEVLLRKAYGSRALVPAVVPMTADTVFDLASLTKPLATASSVMILVERGRIALGAPAARYVPELAKLPPFTVEHLLLHTSGLPAATAVSDYTSAPADRRAVMRRLGETLAGKLKTEPGERFLYSDVGFIVLEEIVHRQSGKELSTFAAEEVWRPLGMTETSFLPEPFLRERAAPTEQREGRWMQGEVHDPRAFAMGGVAGHAGAFSTVDDLSRFARALLGRGALSGTRVMSERTFATWTARHETSIGGRALGWDHDGPRLSFRAFGHGGFTGTSMWVDPARDRYLVFLSNRVHPDGKGSVLPLVGKLTNLAVDATDTRTGIDVLRAESFERLKGARVGLVTNQSARAHDGTSTIDALRAAPDVTLVAIFSPEHGLAGVAEGKVGDAAYGRVPVYSLYGDRAAPNASQLDGVDTVVFDLQDAGARFYTYASTMKLAMKVAAERKLRFVVLDRPNPIGGVEVAGPVLDPSRGASFVNHHALPVRHGMTMGELARLFAADDRLELALEVVPMKGWTRPAYFDSTGLTWVSPSPNLRTVDEAVLYPAVGLLESTNLSVGRGTDTPFELIGAPYVDGPALARSITSRGVGGLAVEAATFTPSAPPHRGVPCKGVRLKVTDRARFEPVKAALAIALSLRELHGAAWDMEHLDRMLGSQAALDALRAGDSVDAIAATWAEPLAAFVQKRAAYLLY